MKPLKSKIAVLLVAHGSRHARQDDMLLRISAEVKRLEKVDTVEFAYGGLRQPDIQAGFDRCVVAGAGKVIVYPCFLLAGKHVHDLPNEITRAKSRYPELEVQLEQPLGTDPALACLVSDSLKKSLSIAG